MKKKIRNISLADSIESASQVSHSGNSDVDVKVIVDTTPIAYAMLCTLLSTKQITNDEFKRSVKQLEDLIQHGKGHWVEDSNDLSYVKLNHKLLRG
ncbi:hypothetical protein [Oceanobacillus sp. J11TS1]|uniref:hypothetical protein n=1 Tax=Oceanobacillus sp. J11TS1 TaxID=2807191 RepID=UPI001AFEFF8A|nr:hypothetical protein [Oceanobacillus sp. J11TS1]GIO21463.1 hypothetical protein J11TS1_00440 [Oceanobacillus sp. J11TS1]